ncbi:MAG: hypothetical protein IPJ94_05365 [Chloroflexi bacterium]|nr:hypothetical protein [Chloroflexota bacterium]
MDTDRTNTCYVGHTLARLIGIATIDWDGADGNALSTNYTGLNSADLTNGGSNDAFHLQIPFDDLKAKVRIEVYTDSTNWSYTEIILPGGIISNSHVDFTLPFFHPGMCWRSFSNEAHCNDPDGNFSCSDVTVDYLEADPGRDYGDAPDIAPPKFHSHLQGAAMLIFFDVMWT